MTVTGENLDAVTGVAIDGSNITMLQPNRSSFKFELPKSLEPDLAYECTLKTTGGNIKLTVNEPVVAWSQGDEGKTATPGGWIRVNGECLKLGNRIGTLELTASGEKFTLTADDIKDASSIGFTVPDDIPYGTYTARYSNGSAVSEKFEVEIGASPRDSWPTEVFNVLDYGAVAAHTGYTSEVNFDNSDALRAALKAAGENGGGIVYFPRGFYHMTGANFIIPDNTVIRGEGMNLVRVFWGGESGSGWTIDTLPSCIFKSRNGNCALEDITFQGALMPTFLDVGNKPRYDEYGENVYVRHCRIWSNMYARDNGFWSSEYGKYTEEDIEHYNSLDAAMFVARCQNFQITDCELEWDTTVLGANHAFKIGYYKNLLFRDCELMRTGCHCMIDGGIVEDNSFTGSPKGSFVFGINGENCYLARNYFNEGADSGDRESISSDWNSGTKYHGKITFTDDTHIIFPEEAELDNMTDVSESYFKPRVAVQIIAGTGAGQYRYITERRGSALTLERPFDIWDETSEFTCARLNSHWYIIDNTLKNTGDCQFYTGQTDSIFQGNIMYYAGGFQTVGTEIYGSWQIAWNISYVENRIEAGMYYFRFGNDGHSKFQAMAQGDPGLRINIGMTVRRNEFLDESFAEIYMPEGSVAGSDMILEDNFFKDTHWGYRFSGRTCFKRTVMSGNRYENVDIPYITPLTNPDDLLMPD